MLIRRLQWAGAFIESKGIRILIDPVYGSPNPSFFGKPKQPFNTLNDIDNPHLILVTHLHSDHFDPELIKQGFSTDTLVLVPSGLERQAVQHGLNNVRGISVGEEYSIEEITIYASHAVDGLGDPQVSWVVKDGEKTILHSGDTLWHGYWWKMSEAYGPFDACLLPVNGAIVQEAGQIYSVQPICMNPEQAVAAAKVLKAAQIIPIHYDSYNNPPTYVETENITNRLKTASQEHQVKLLLLQQDEEVHI
jgi:L-ascorbate metabolism protein UlaG (beta-lactamase superfamily)